MTRPPLSVGLIGCGDIAITQHLPALARSSDCKVQIVCDLDLAKAQSTAAAFGVPTSTRSVDQVLEAGLDAIFVATPPTATPHIAAKALDRAIPVFCEKPIAVNREDAAMLVAAQHAAGVPCQVGYKNRFAPQVVMLHQWLDGLGPTNLLARVNSFDEVWYPGASDPEFLARTRANLESNDPIVHEGTHHIDLLTWMLGKVESVVSASRLRLNTDEALQPHYTTAILRFQNGNVGQVETGWCFPYSIKGEIQIWSPLGFAEVSRNRSTLLISDGHSETVTMDPSDWQAGAFDGQLAAFVDLVQGGTQRGATVAEASQALDVALRIVAMADDLSPVAPLN